MNWIGTVNGVPGERDAERRAIRSDFKPFVGRLRRLRATRRAWRERAVTAGAEDEGILEAI